MFLFLFYFYLKIDFKSYDPFADTGEEETQAKSFDYIRMFI